MRRDAGATAPAATFLHAATGHRISGVAGTSPPVVAQTASVSFGAGPFAIPFASGVGAGDLLVACLGMDTATSGTVTDNLGSSWARQTFRDNANVGRVEIHSAKAASAGACTVTVTTGAGGDVSGLIFQVSHVASPATADAVATAADNAGAAITGPNLSGLAGASDFVVYWAIYNPPGNTASGGIWTNDYTVLIAGQHFFGAAYAITGPTVTGPTLSPGTSSVFALASAAFKP